jgi:MoaA/NifB/PqqE/SkfB family radical SAM enzyme
MKTLIKKIKKILFVIQISIKYYYQIILIFVSKHLNKPLNKPTSIIINITWNCILHCHQCNLWKSKPEKQISFDQAKIIIDRLHDWLGNFYLFFTGGEPFVNKNLPEIIKYAQSIGIICHINSNAFLIDKKLAKRIIDSKLDSISISLDGAKASTHDYLRGTPNTHEKVIQAIRLLQRNGPKIYINTVIMKQNVSELTQLISLSQKENVKRINFQCLLPTLASNDTVNDLKKSSLWPKFSDVKSEIQKIIKLDNSKKHKLLANKKLLEQIIKYYQDPVINNKNIICAAGINNFIIDRKGDVRLCFYLPAIGNIFKSTAKDMWLNKKAQQQRKIIRKCQKTCKIIGCNKIEINRQIDVQSRSF